MNVENIKLVRDHIASLPPERFDMTVYAGERLPSGEVTENMKADIVADCGTVACICGWTVALLGLDCGLDDDFTAGQALGLDWEEASALFIPSERAALTTAHAVAVLDHLMATGKVDWRKRVKPRGQEGSAVSDGPLGPHALGTGGQNPSSTDQGEG